MRMIVDGFRAVVLPCGAFECPAAYQQRHDVAESICQLWAVQCRSAEIITLHHVDLFALEPLS